MSKEQTGKASQKRTISDYIIFNYILIVVSALVITYLVFAIRALIRFQEYYSQGGFIVLIIFTVIIAAVLIVVWLLRIFKRDKLESMK